MVYKMVYMPVKNDEVTGTEQEFTLTDKSAAIAAAKRLIEKRKHVYGFYVELYSEKGEPILKWGERLSKEKVAVTSKRKRAV